MLFRSALHVRRQVVQHALLPGFAVADISTITETGMQSLGRTAVAFCPQPFQSGEYEALYGSDFL